MRPARDRTAAAANAFLASLLVLVAAAAASVASSTFRGERRGECSRGFQELVGGLGLGPAVDLSVCEPDFDPRVGDVCARSVGSVPGAAAFCAHRAGPAHAR